MKKNTVKVAVLMAIFSVCGFMASAAGKTDFSAAKNDKISVVTTIFPEYDWVKNIAGDNVNLTYLMESGADLHSWQPSSADIVKISTCDVFIYVGGESDHWVEGALKNSVNKNLVAINLLEVLGESVKAEEVVEGMQAEEEHDHEHGEADHDEHEHDHELAEHEHEEEIEYDEHVWLSLKNAQVLCSDIAAKLAKIDPANAATYAENVNSYNAKLSALDGEYATAVKGSKRNVVLFGDRFPFRYLVDDYGINYYAAFVGCSAETEASFKTVAFLSGKVDELKLPVVMVIEKSDKKIANTIIKNTKDKNQEVLVLDSMQSVNSKNVSDGESYYSIMQKNLEVLKTALN